MDFLAQPLLGTNAPISSLRGKFHDRNGVRVMPTFHPAYLLREEGRKRDAWSEKSVEQPSHHDPAQQARSAKYGRAQRRVSGCEASIRQQRGEVSNRPIHAD